MSHWTLNQANRIDFVMVDATGAEVAGLGAGYGLELAKSGGAFAPGAGTQSEIGHGWYSYLAPAAEADTVGPVAIRVNGAGCVQQNLEYVVEQRNAGAIEYTYTVRDSTTLLPIEGVEVWFATDIAGANVVWAGDTDAFGVARDDAGRLPWLDSGSYFIFSQKAGYTFAVDTEVVS